MKQTILLIAAILLHVSISFSQSLYNKEGKASYYSKGFEGRNTANGEIFSSSLLTAAHLTLPFGTLVKVTNLSNGKSVVVRINDRGPYVKGRILDLSQAAADSLDFIHEGWTVVRIEELPAPMPEIVKAFPAAWAGTWSGDLNIYTTEGLKETVPMKVIIHPTPDPNNVEWTIVYNNEPRNYQLVTVDAAKGSYLMDEKNGTEISGYFIGNQFICRFEVDGNYLECVYEMKKEDELTFEIRSGDEEQKTGGVQTTSDSIPEVHSYRVNVLQQADLDRTGE